MVVLPQTIFEDPRKGFARSGLFSPIVRVSCLDMTTDIAYSIDLIIRSNAEAQNSSCLVQTKILGSGIDIARVIYANQLTGEWRDEGQYRHDELYEGGVVLG